MGGAEDALERRRVQLGALFQGGEDRPAVVVDDDQGQVESRLARPEDQPVGVVEERPSPSSARSGTRSRRPRASDRGGDRPVDAGQAAVPHDEPVLVGEYGVVIRSRSRTGFDEPATRVA